MTNVPRTNKNLPSVLKCTVHTCSPTLFVLRSLIKIYVYLYYWALTGEIQARKLD